MRRPHCMSCIYSNDSKCGYVFSHTWNFHSNSERNGINALCLYITEQDTLCDAEADVRRAFAALPGSHRKIGRLILCRLYSGAVQRGSGAHPLYCKINAMRRSAQKFRISRTSVKQNLRTLIRNCWEKPDRIFSGHIAG